MAEDIQKRLKTLTKQKDSLLGEKATAEVELKQSKASLEELEPEVKELFGTTDPKKLEKIGANLLDEAEQLLNDLNNTEEEE